MKFKKYLLFIIFLAVVDAFVCLGVNADLISVQEDFSSAREVLNKAEERNSKLEREVAHLSSLKEISEKAENLGLANAKDKVVYVEKDQFARKY